MTSFRTPSSTPSRRRASSPPGTNLKAWLFTILRNRFRSVIARKHVTAEVVDENLESISSVPAFQENGLEVAAFKRAFRRLSPAHREVLILAGIHGYAYEQIAEMCNCEVGTVKSRVNRARSMLKKMLVEGDVPVDVSRLPGSRREHRPLSTPRDLDERAPAAFLPPARRRAAGSHYPFD